MDRTLSAIIEFCNFNALFFANCPSSVKVQKNYELTNIFMSSHFCNCRTLTLLFLSHSCTWLQVNAYFLTLSIFIDFPIFFAFIFSLSSQRQKKHPHNMMLSLPCIIAGMIFDLELDVWSLASLEQELVKPL